MLPTKTDRRTREAAIRTRCVEPTHQSQMQGTDLIPNTTHPFLMTEASKAAGPNTAKNCARVKRWSGGMPGALFTGGPLPVLASLDGLCARRLRTCSAWRVLHLWYAADSRLNHISVSQSHAGESRALCTLHYQRGRTCHVVNVPSFHIPARSSQQRIVRSA